MTFYVVWEQDTGKLLQGNKIYYPDEAYEAAANELGHNWVRAHDYEIKPPEEWWAPAGDLQQRPVMRITLDSPAIQAGEKSAAIFRDLPNPVRWSLICMGMIVHTDIATKPLLEVSVPAPGTYEMMFEEFPFQIARFTFEAQ